MSGRRATLTVDLDCWRCAGKGFEDKEVIIGWGPDSHRVTVYEPCRCLVAVPIEEEAKDDEKD